MRILDNYIFRSIVAIYFSCILMFSVLYVLIDVATRLDNFIENHVSIQTLFEYYTSFLPIIVVQTSPVASLISVLFTYSHLNANNEIIALRASGLNFWQITKPAIVFGILTAAFLFLVNERYVPQSTIMSQEIKQAKMKDRVGKTKRQPEIFHLTFYGLKNRLYFIDKFDPNDYSLHGITIVGQDNQQKIKEKIVAFKGKWTGLAWQFSNVQMTTYDPTNPNDEGDLKMYPKKLMDIKETPKDFLKQRLNVSSMNIVQLMDYIQRFSASGATSVIKNLKVDLYQKTAYPVGNLIIILTGLPLVLAATGRRKGTTFISIGIAMSITFLYYVTNAVGLALGKGGALPPLLAAWMTPLIFFGVAIFLIKKKF